MTDLKNNQLLSTKRIREIKSLPVRSQRPVVMDQDTGDIYMSKPILLGYTGISQPVQANKISFDMYMSIILN